MTFSLVGLWFLAWQYKFWCMHHKMRIGDEEVAIPWRIRGKWLEDDGRNIWDTIGKDLADPEHTSIFGNPEVERAEMAQARMFAVTDPSSAFAQQLAGGDDDSEGEGSAAEDIEVGGEGLDHSKWEDLKDLEDLAAGHRVHRMKEKPPS